MKISGLNVPTELARLWGILVSVNQTGAHAGAHARTKRGARISPSKQKPRQEYNNITAAVEELIVRLGTPRGSADFASKVVAEKEAINSGEWNPAHWIKCEVISTNYLGNVPASSPDANPPPYSYRTGSNLPTVATYGDGSTNSAPARYSGATSGGRFADTLLVWSRTIYKLAQPVDGTNGEPAIIDYQGTLTVSASYRGSRPMLSLALRCYLTSDTGAALTSTENPVTSLPPSAPPTARGCNSFYWRYVIPATTPPFFSAVRLRKIMRNLAEISTVEGGGSLTRAVVIACPRPMFGRGFNNNMTVNSSLAGVPEIYQILRVPKTMTARAAWFATANGVQYNNTTAGGITLRSKITALYESPSDDPEWGYSLTIKEELCLLGLSITVADFKCYSSAANYPPYKITGTVWAPQRTGVVIENNGEYIQWETAKPVNYTSWFYPTETVIWTVWRKYKNGLLVKIEEREAVVPNPAWYNYYQQAAKITAGT